MPYLTHQEYVVWIKPNTWCKGPKQEVRHRHRRKNDVIRLLKYDLAQKSTHIPANKIQGAPDYPALSVLVKNLPVARTCYEPPIFLRSAPLRFGHLPSTALDQYPRTEPA